MHMGVKEASALLGVSDKTVYRWLADGKIPSVRIGAQHRFNRTELMLWAESSGRAHVAHQMTGAPRSLSLALQHGGIHYRVEGEDVETSIRHLVALTRIESVDINLLVKLLLDREAMESTAIGDGIALPHPRNPIPHLDEPRLALGFLESPVDFRALDKKPVQALFLLLSPSSGEHLNLLSRVSHMLRNPIFSQLIKKQALRGQILETVESLDHYHSER
jgi:PTS system nitrogen regulatory IIA component